MVNIFSLAKRSALTSWAVVIFCLTFSPLTIYAQFGKVDTDPASGMGGRSTIEGHLYYPSGRPVDKRLRIRLTGGRGSDQMAVCDENGSFTFRRIPSGSYSVMVDAGKEYEFVNEMVDIREKIGGTVALVSIQLRLKNQNSEHPGVLDATLAGVPKSAVKLFDKALSLIRAGEREKAIAQLKAALDIHPGFAAARSELGVQYLRLGQLDQAEATLAKGLELAPDDFSLNLNRGVVLVQKKDFAAAEGALKLALAKNSTSATAYLYHGRALIGLGQLDEAEKDLQQCLSLGGEATALAHRYLGALYNQRGERERAIQELEAYLRLAPNEGDVESVRAIVKNMRAENKP